MDGMHTLTLPRCEVRVIMSCTICVRLSQTALCPFTLVVGSTDIDRHAGMDYQ